MHAILVLMLSLSAGENPELALEKTETGFTVLEAETKTPLMRYRARDVAYKPYVEALYSPAGINVLRDSPADHVHHHALMLAFKVDGVNYWEEYEEPGHQIGTGVYINERRSLDPPTMPQFVHFVAWKPQRNADAALLEQRDITVTRTGEPEATLLTWNSKLTATGGARVLEGSHYHGLGIRFVESMDADGTFRYGADNEREHVRGSEYLTFAPWCAYTAEAEGKTVTVAMFDDPANPRPALWFTMSDPFTYISATINLWREPLNLNDGGEVAFRYGVAVLDGDVSGEAIGKIYEYWKAAITDVPAAESGE